MSTPVLTDAEVRVLRLLAHKGALQKRPKVIRSDSILKGRIISAQGIVGAASAACGPDACGLTPLQDNVDYHSQTVQDAVDQEISFIERVDSEWIALAHEISCRVYAIQKEISDHWKIHQYGQMAYALGLTYSTTDSRTRHYTNTAVSCGTMLTRVNAVFGNVVGSANRSLHRQFRRFRADTTNRPGLTAVWYTGQSALANATHHLNKWSTRRQHMYQQHWAETANATYHATRQQPDGIFQLMTTAQGLYADIAAGAAQEQKAQKQSTLSKVGQVIGIAAAIASFA